MNFSLRSLMYPILDSPFPIRSPSPSLKLVEILLRTFYLLTILQFLVKPFTLSYGAKILVKSSLIPLILPYYSKTNIFNSLITYHLVLCLALVKEELPLNLSLDNTVFGLLMLLELIMVIQVSKFMVPILCI